MDANDFHFLCLSGATFSIPMPKAFGGNPKAILATILFISTWVDEPFEK